MNELEYIKQKKLAQLMEQQQNRALNEELELQYQLNQIEAAIKGIMTKDALERYGNIKVAHPQKAVQVLAVFGQLMRKKNLVCINDQLLKEVLQNLTQDKKDIKIKII